MNQNDFENDDLATFQLQSKSIKVNYSQLIRYSKYFRDKYLFSDAIKYFPNEFNNFQDQNKISSDSVDYFFQFLTNNCTISEDLELTYIQCTDILKISEHLEIRKLSYEMEEYVSNRNSVDFIIQMIHYKSANNDFLINSKIEEILSNKIDECFENETFADLNISIIYRVVEKSFSKGINNDCLYDFIKKSINKFSILFSFLNLQMLSKDRFQDLYKLYSNDQNKKYFIFLKCDLNLINQIYEDNQRLQEQLNQFKNKLDSYQINGQVVANVTNNLLINAQINVIVNGTLLDILKSKYIISTDNSETLGAEAYEFGEPITSLNTTITNLLVKEGTYYIRCILFEIGGRSIELISNAVTTHGNSISFNYEDEKSTEVSLMKGKYKLEVWGAQGGDSKGTRHNSTPPGKGGLGGYSSGVLTLNENKKIHILVGGKGQTANPVDNEITKGGFPDGGDTKTSHMTDTTSVPGTGGGSTSIRLSNDDLYSRIIVAGGGGGASGDSYNLTIGGFGGGLNGGNCYYEGKPASQGAGTQTGSSCGLGWAGNNGDPGVFGKGATNKNCTGRDTGGGGGGGWYGGGSGGYGSNNCCSSGGGGSGWTFTESNFNDWKSGDSENANKFKIDKKYYLTNTFCIPGDEEFPTIDGRGTEKGHSGDGYAKITIE